MVEEGQVVVLELGEVDCEGDGDAVVEVAEADVAHKGESFLTSNAGVDVANTSQTRVITLRAVEDANHRHVVANNSSTGNWVVSEVTIGTLA